MRNRTTGFSPTFKYGIARRLILYILLFSTLVIVFSTLFQLFLAYREDVAGIGNRIENIKESYLKGIARSVWELDEDQINIQMEGILRLPDMQYLEVRESDGRTLTAGNPQPHDGIRRQFRLVYSSGGKAHDLGSLLVVAGLKDVYHRLVRRAVVTLVTQAVQMIMFSAFIFFLFHFLVGRHLHAIAVYAGSLDMSLPGTPLKLQRRSGLHTGMDELDQLVFSINEMHGNLRLLYRSLETKVAELKDNVAGLENTEKALRENEERYRLLAEQTIQGIAVLRGLPPVFVYVNPAWTRIFGYSSEEALSMNAEQIWNLVHPDDRPFVRERNRNRLMGNPAEPQYEFRILRKDGGERWVEVYANIVEEGSSPSSQALYIDITDRKRSEEDRVMLATAIAHAADAVILTDRRGRIEYVNPAMENATGFSRDELTGNNFAVLRCDQHDDAFYRNMWKQISQGQVWSGHIINRIKDGSLCEFETKISPIRDTLGKIAHFVSVNRDVTQEIRMEKQFRQSQKMEAIGTLAGGIAHDFNNILAAILGYTELTRATLPQGTAAYQNLEQVINASYRARDLVQQILLFSRQSADELKPLSLRLIVKEALQLLRATIPSTIEIRQTLTASSGSRIMADPTQVHQVLMNLGTNAAHAMREKGGVLTVTLSDVDLTADGLSHPQLKPGPHVLLTVGDTGHGMDRSVMDRIFDPFFTTKPSGEGTGMGLSVVHGIVQRHNGVLVVSSRPQEGTVFELYFPRVADIRAAAPENRPAETKGRGRILFVDDEKTLVELVQQILTYLGYEVAASTGSEEALSLFRASPDRFDLVITDYTMPRMTGIALAKEMMNIRPGVPIILCTGYNEMITETDARSIGIREFILKPVTISELSKKVAAALDPEGSQASAASGP